MEIFSPGKINLTLDVLGMREDGYHEVATVMHTIDFGDVLSFHPNEEGTLDLQCTQSPRKNLFLIEKAYDLFCDHVGQRFGVTIRLEKHLPMMAGLGGGSSNAAKTLEGLNELFSCRVSLKDLQKMAEELGSDVPFFLHGGAAVARGRGTEIKPLDWKAKAYALLVYDEIALSSRQVYEKLDTMGERQVPMTETFLESIREDGDWTKAMGNHLEKPAFSLAPALAGWKKVLLELGAESAFLSGSGGVMFGIFKDRADAVSAKMNMNVKTWIAKLI